MTTTISQQPIAKTDPKQPQALPTDDIPLASGPKSTDNADSGLAHIDKVRDETGVKSQAADAYGASIGKKSSNAPQKRP